MHIYSLLCILWLSSCTCSVILNADWPIQYLKFFEQLHTVGWPSILCSFLAWLDSYYSAFKLFLSLCLLIFAFFIPRIDSTFYKLWAFAELIQIICISRLVSFSLFSPGVKENTVSLSWLATVVFCSLGDSSRNWHLG